MPSRKAMIAALCVVLLAGGIIFFATGHNLSIFGKTIGREKRLKTEEEAIASFRDKIKKQGVPASSSNKEKIAHYVQLAALQSESGQYKEATQTLKKAQAISKEALNYRDYFDLAGYQYKSGDKEAALKSLERSESLMPLKDNAEQGYFRDNFKAAIDARKQTYQK